MISTAQATLDSDEPTVEKILDSVVRPEFVLKVQHERGEDFDGQPVWWIWVTVPYESNPKTKHIDKFLSFGNNLRDRLIGAGVHAYPHVRFHEFRPRVRRNAAAG